MKQPAARNASIRHWYPVAYAAVLAGLLFLATWRAAISPDLMPALGLALAAGSPLIFLCWQRFGSPRHRHHPVLVSVGSGFGCVIGMIAVQRFGEQHQWLLGLSLLALIGWMIYQRWIWRGTAEGFPNE